MSVNEQQHQTTTATAATSTNSSYKSNASIKYNEIINSIAVNKDGKYVCLGGKKALQIVDLDTLKNAKCFMQQSKWEVGVVDWNNMSPNLIASSSNQDAFIWDAENSKFPLLGQFVSHTRAISDLSWSLFDQNVLATTSADTFVHLWDLRAPKRVMKLKSFNSHIPSAIQVKWNKFNSHILASAHESNLMIWDIRKETQELNTTVHTTKVYGIDWSPHDPSEILTCSQDKTVKIWSYPSPKPKSTITTGAPVLRAKYLPIGKGIVTISDRGENHIRLWGLSDLNTPVATFVGHSDSVRSFDFRVNASSNDIQIVSWSKDQHLRLWKFEDYMKQSCLIETDNSNPLSPNLTSSPTTTTTTTTNTANNVLNTSSPNLSSSLSSTSSLNIMDDGQQQLVHSNTTSPTISSPLMNSQNLNNQLSNSLSSDKESIESSYTVSGSKHEETDYFMGPKELEYELKIIQNKFIDKTLKIDQVNIAQRMCIVTCTVSQLHSSLTHSVSGENLLNSSNGDDLKNNNMSIDDINNNNNNNNNNSIINTPSSTSSSSSSFFNNNQESSLQVTSVQLKITFPSLYPQSASPHFECIRNFCTTSLKSNKYIVDTLNAVASSRLGKPCFEQCLIKFVTIIKKEISLERNQDLDTSLNNSMVDLNKSVKKDLEDSFNNVLGDDSFTIEPIPSSLVNEGSGDDDSGFRGKQILNMSNNNNKQVTGGESNKLENENDNEKDKLQQQQQFTMTKTSDSIPIIKLNKSGRGIDNTHNNNNDNIIHSPSGRSPSLINSKISKSFERTLNSPLADSLIHKSISFQSIANGSNSGGSSVQSKSDVSPQLTHLNNSYNPSCWVAAPSLNTTSEVSLSSHRTSISIKSIQDNFPCPRLFGATFGPNDKLIIFSNSFKNQQQQQQQQQSSTQQSSSTSTQSTQQSSSQSTQSGGEFKFNIPRTYKELITVISGKQYIQPQNTNSPMMIYDSPILSEYRHSFGSTSQMSPVSLSPILTNLLHENPTLSSRNNNSNSLIIKSHLKLVELGNLSPIDIELANLYKLNGTVDEICRHNRMVAESFNRKDLVKLWSTLSMVTDHNLFLSSIENTIKQQQLNQQQQQQQQQEIKSTRKSTLSLPNGSGGSSGGSTGGINNSSNKLDLIDDAWTIHPLGRPLVKSLFNHYKQIGDVQTLAMMTCLLITSAQHLNGILLKYLDENSLFNPVGPLNIISLHSSGSNNNVNTSSYNSQIQINPINQNNLSANNSNQLSSLPLNVSSGTGSGKSPSLMLSPPSFLGFISGGNSVSGSMTYDTSSSVSSTPIPSFASNYINNNNNSNLTNSGSSTYGFLSNSYNTIQSQQTNQNQLSNFGSTFGQPNHSLMEQQIQYQQQQQQQLLMYEQQQQLIHQQQQQQAAYLYDSNLCLLDSKEKAFYDHYINSYGEVLFKWGLLEKRAEILKYLHQHDSSPSKKVQFQIVCFKCQRPLVDNCFCSNCKVYAIKCSICHISVRGLSSFCVNCGHGGHTDHLKKWFNSKRECPTGCGCKCNLSFSQQHQQQFQLKNNPNNNNSLLIGKDNLIPDTFNQQQLQHHHNHHHSQSNQNNSHHHHQNSNNNNNNNQNNHNYYNYDSNQHFIEQHFHGVPISS